MKKITTFILVFILQSLIGYWVNTNIVWWGSIVIIPFFIPLYIMTLQQEETNNN